jgi:hypothetical protein
MENSMRSFPGPWAQRQHLNAFRLCWDRGHVPGLDSARGFQRCQKPTMTGDGLYQTLMVMTWGWFMIGFTTKDIYIYTIYYIMLYHIVYIVSNQNHIISYHIILYYIMFCIILYIMTHKLIYTTREVEGQQLTLHSACLIRTADGGTLAPRFP